MNHHAFNELQDMNKAITISDAFSSKIGGSKCQNGVQVVYVTFLKKNRLFLLFIWQILR